MHGWFLAGHIGRTSTGDGLRIGRTLWNRRTKRSPKVIEVEEYVPLALGLLGEILLLEDEQDQAVEVLEKAVGLAPNHAYNTAYLADALCYVGRLEESCRKGQKGDTA